MGDWQLATHRDMTAIAYNPPAMFDIFMELPVSTINPAAAILHSPLHLCLPHATGSHLRVYLKTADVTSVSV